MNFRNNFFWVLVLSYDLLFWRTETGLNQLLFHLLLCGLLIYQEKKPLQGKDWMLLAGLLAADLAILYHASTFACWLSWIGIICFTANYKYPQLGFTLLGILSMAEELVLAPFRFLSGRKEEDRSTKRPVRWLMFFIPAALAALFLLLYVNADSLFANRISNALTQIQEWLNWLPDLLSISHLVHLLWSLILVYALYRVYVRKLQHWLHFRLVWDRQRKKGPGTGVLALKQEWQLALVTLLTLNLLTLLFNLNDITHYWFRFSVPEKFDLKQFVHGGTWLTVISILLSVIVLLYINRANLLFWPGKPWLKYLSMAWILQNGIMGISVFWRNYHYITFHGFAFKRLGVLFFLVCLVIGLVLLWLMLDRKKTLTWLMERSTLWMLMALSFLSLPDWNMMMLRYNLNHPIPANIDTRFYFALAPHCLPTLMENQDIILKQITDHSALGARGWIVNTPEGFKNQLQISEEELIQRFNKDYKWPAYSYKKYAAWKELTTQHSELKNK